MDCVQKLQQQERQGGMKKDMTRRQRTSAGAIRLKQTEDRDVHGHGKEKQERIRSRDNAQQTTGQMLPKGSRKTKLKVSNNVSNVKYTSKSKSKKAPKQHLQANTAFSPIKMEKNNESVATGGSAESLTENKRKRKRKRESEQGQYVKLKKQRESEQGQCVNLKKQRENEQGQCVNLKKQRESEQGQCVNLKQRDGLHTEWSAAQSSAEKVSGLTRKQRRSRKKNNSKKNKYKHLALASKDIVGGGGAETSITASSMVARIESRPTVHGNSMEFHSNTDTTVKQFTVKPSPVKQPAVKKFAQNALNSVQTPARVAASTTEQNAKLADSVFNSEKAKQKKSKLKLCDSPADANSSQSNWIGRAEPMSFIEKAREKLQAARFRFLNEQLYTSRGDQAWELFQTDPDAFHVYHQGFQTQASRWPLNPLDTIIQQLQSLWVVTSYVYTISSVLQKFETQDWYIYIYFFFFFFYMYESYWKDGCHAVMTVLYSKLGNCWMYGSCVCHSVTWQLYSFWNSKLWNWRYGILCM